MCQNPNKLLLKVCGWKNTFSCEKRSAMGQILFSPM